MNDGGPFFPTIMREKTDTPGVPWLDVHKPGASLRDWYAGQALTGLLAMCASSRVATTLEEVGVDSLETDMARHAYLAADAMLAAREDGGAS